MSITPTRRRFLRNALAILAGASLGVHFINKGLEKRIIESRGSVLSTRTPKPEVDIYALTDPEIFGDYLSFAKPDGSRGFNIRAFNEINWPHTVLFYVDLMQNYKPVVEKTLEMADQYGFDRALSLAMVFREAYLSDHYLRKPVLEKNKEDTVFESEDGARGLLGIMKGTWKEFCEKERLRRIWGEYNFGKGWRDYSFDEMYGYGPGLEVGFVNFVDASRRIDSRLSELEGYDPKRWGGEKTTLTLLAHNWGMGNVSDMLDIYGACRKGGKALRKYVGRKRKKIKRKNKNLWRIQERIRDDGEMEKELPSEFIHRRLKAASKANGCYREPRDYTRAILGNQRIFDWILKSANIPRSSLLEEEWERRYSAFLRNEEIYPPYRNLNGVNSPYLFRFSANSFVFEGISLSTRKMNKEQLIEFMDNLGKRVLERGVPYLQELNGKFQ